MGYSSLSAEQLTKDQQDEDRKRVRDFAIARLAAIENSMRHKHYDAARMTLRRTIQELQRM